MRRSSRSPSLERILERRPSFDRPPVRSMNSPKMTEKEALMLTSPFLGYRTRYTYAKSSCYNAEETDAWEVPNLANNLEIKEEYERANMALPGTTSSIFTKMINALCIIAAIVGGFGRAFVENVFINVPLKFISICCDIAEAVYTPVGISVSLLSHGIKSFAFVLGNAIVNLSRAIKNCIVNRTIQAKDSASIYASTGFSGLSSALITGVTSSINHTSSFFGSLIAFGAESSRNAFRKVIYFFRSLFHLVLSSIKAVIRAIVWTLTKMKMGICTIHDALIKPKRVSISEVSQTLAFDIDSTPMSIIKGDAEFCATTPVSRESGLRNIAGRRLLRSRRLEVDSDESFSEQFLTSTPLPSDEGDISHFASDLFYYPAYIIGIVAFALIEALRSLSLVAIYFLLSIKRVVIFVWDLLKSTMNFIKNCFVGLFTSVIGTTSGSSEESNKKYWLYFLLILLLALLIPFLLPFYQENDVVEPIENNVTSQEEIVSFATVLSEKFHHLLFVIVDNVLNVFEYLVEHWCHPFLSFLIRLRSSIYIGILNTLDLIFIIFEKIHYSAASFFPVITNKVVDRAAPQTDTFNNEKAAIIQKVKADLQAEIDEKLESFKNSYQIELDSLKNMKGVSQNDFAQLSAFVRQLIYQYDVDKTGLFDYALESAGASVLSTRCSENYESYSRLEKIWNIPLWFTSYGPRTVIQRNSNSLFPGECWCFKSGKGYLTINLSHSITVSSISYEHIAKSQTPDGKLSSAPKNVKFWAYKSENDLESRVLLGEFEYDIEEAALQFFIVKESPDFPVKIVELETVDNYGADFTCLYRLRVHGQIPKN